MSACAAVRRQLDAFATGEAADGRDDAVRVHLRRCPDCRRRLGAVLRARRALAELAVDAERPLPGGSLVDDVLDALPSALPPRPTVTVGWRWAAAAAVVLLGVAAGWTWGRDVGDAPGQPTRQPSPLTAAAAAAWSPSAEAGGRRPPPRVMPTRFRRSEDWLVPMGYSPAQGLRGRDLVVDPFDWRPHARAPAATGSMAADRR